MKMHELLVYRRHWTQGTLAREVDGTPCTYRSESACCWCLTGALRKCYPVFWGAALVEQTLLKYISKNYVAMDIAGWNDDPSRTFDQVREMLVELDV